ncbi:hypothetical protein FB451DRAFT_1307536 [Mycena latifolia]|nr:hypothetical protein FB451DRAFT_1307536 [Mycena latifolia]
MHPTASVDYAAKIPTEIWTRCWSSSSPHDLRRLVFICRYFRDICQPLLFEHQRFRSPDAEEIDRSNWRSAIKDIRRSTIRLKKLVASPHASSVRSWYFRGNLGYPSLVETHPMIINIGLVDETYTTLVATFCSTLGTQQNIRSLRLESMTIDTAFREALSSLSRLEELTLESCDIVARKGRLLSLHAFTLVRFTPDQGDAYCDQPLELVSPETLHALTIGTSRDSRALLSVLSDETLTFPNLVTLSMELTNAAVASFMTFLERCPQLTQLDISKSFVSDPIQTHLAPATIPLLRAFKGPRLLAAPFVLDRPVSSVHLCGGSGFDDENKSAEKDIIRDLACLANSAVPVHSLIMSAPLKMAVELFGAIATHFPDLRELALALRAPRQVRLASLGNRYIDDSSSDESEEEELDTRTVEFSDNESLESLMSFGGIPDVVFSDDSEDEGLPEDLLPGYMYTTSGGVFPPAGPQSAPIATTTESTSSLIDCICAELASLWDDLRRAGPLTLADQHRAILTLAHQLPDLRKLDFEVYGSVWTRHRDTWAQRRSGTVIVPLGKSEV